ncbi:hypothetical protein LTR27_010492 [Elasticomyces elasticus]|nr:hypothetical protein LTR27_010492 [Elasticomyces elasticus]
MAEPKPSGRKAKVALKQQQQGPVLPPKRDRLVDLQRHTVLSDRTPLAELSANQPRLLSATKHQQQEPVYPPNRAPLLEQSGNVPPKRNPLVPLQAPTSLPVYPSQDRAGDYGLIDPALFSSAPHQMSIDPTSLIDDSIAVDSTSLTDDSIVVDSGRLNSLCDAVFPDADVDATAARPDKGLDDEAAHGQIDRNSLPSVANLSFVDAYAQYNVVCNKHCSVEWKKYDPADVTSFDATIGRYCMRGNSRDDPTPCLYFCKKTTGCTYQTTVQRRMTTHENDCTSSTVESIAEGAAVLQSLSNAPDDDPRVCPRAKATGCTFKAIGKNPEASIKSHLA